MYNFWLDGLWSWIECIDYFKVLVESTSNVSILHLYIINYSIVYHCICREVFRKGIVEGDKHVIYPILEWLLKRMPDLKERAYLARYLVKVDIPQDFMVDSQLADLYEQVKLNYFQFTIVELMCLSKGHTGM